MASHMTLCKILSVPLDFGEKLLVFLNLFTILCISEYSQYLKQRPFFAIKVWYPLWQKSSVASYIVQNNLILVYTRVFTISLTASIHCIKDVVLLMTVGFSCFIYRLEQLNSCIHRVIKENGKTNNVLNFSLM